MTIRFVRLASGELDHELLWTAVGSAALVTAAVWLRFAGLPPLACPFHAITGLPCPTCGATRALAALMTGRVAVSLDFNPAVLPAVALGLVYAVYALPVIVLRLPRVRVQISSHEARAARWLTLASALSFWAWMIVRSVA